MPRLSSESSELYHRCHTVLRLPVNERLILFDDTHKTIATISGYTKKSVSFSLGNKEPLVKLLPYIHWIVPILKREAFEQAFYSLCEMGATSIYPVTTAKAHRAWGSKKDYERAQTIMIAAAEQAKQFALPLIHPVMPIFECQPGAGMKIFFDPTGEPLPTVLKRGHDAQTWYACVGPEGDLTPEEKEYLRQHGFMVSRLTPTILRAQQAVAVGLGCMRSYVWPD